MVDVEQIRLLLEQEGFERSFKLPVAQRIARERIPLNEVVGHEAHARAFVSELDSLALCARRVVHPREHGDFAPLELPAHQPVRIELRPGMLKRRPSMNEMHDFARTATPTQVGLSGPTRCGVGLRVRLTLNSPERMLAKSAIDPLAHRRERVLLHKSRDRRHVGGMQARQSPRRGALQCGARRTETAMAGMGDECRIVRDVQPAARQRPHAEVVFFTVTEAEAFSVEDRCRREERGG